MTCRDGCKDAEIARLRKHISDLVAAHDEERHHMYRAFDSIQKSIDAMTGTHSE